MWMGLQDRDYMRERAASDKEPPFRPPAEGQSMLLMVLWWLAIAFVLYKMFGWWQEKKTLRVAVATSAQQPRRGAPAPEPSPAGRTEATRVEPQRTAPPSPPPRPTFAAPSAESSVTETPVPRTGPTIYHCKNYSGGTFWAQAHCSQHNALIDRIANVPAGLPFEQQVNIAEQQRHAAERNLMVQSAPPPATAPDHRAECHGLDKEVERLDALARQPQSGQMQDWIRTQRQKARDRQFALRC
jgi:hypothetical protein